MAKNEKERQPPLLFIFNCIGLRLGRKEADSIIDVDGLIERAL